MNQARLVSWLIISCTGAMALTSCGQPEQQNSMEGSRSTIYKSVDELGDDSSAAITGEVVDQKFETDSYGNAVTLSRFLVDKVADLPKEDGAGARTLAPAKIVTIRQLGDESFAETLSPLLEVGETYMLFLTPSGLPGSDARQYFITGNTAGYYKLTDNAALRASEPGYEKVGDEGDTLPVVLTFSEVGQ